MTPVTGSGHPHGSPPGGPRRDLAPLFAPRSIALVGASPSSRVGQFLTANLRRLGYDGRVFPVNPRHEEIAGLRAYPSLTAIPMDEQIDVAVLAVAAKHVLATLREGAQRGLKAAVVTAGGFAEAGPEGAALQDRVADLARASGMLVLGPNCIGLVSPASRHSLYISGLPAGFGSGDVAVVSQSGAIMLSLVTAGRLRYSHLVSSGNEAVLDLTEILEHLVHDASTRVVLAFIEALRDPDRFIRAARAARALDKPLLVVRVGRSERSAAASVAHTGALAGSARVFDAVCRQEGVLVFDDLDGAVEAALLFSTIGTRRAKVGRVGVTTISGGQAALLADLAAERGIELAELTADSRAALAEVVPSTCTQTNPYDIWGDGLIDTRYAPALAAVARDPSVGAVLVCQDCPDVGEDVTEVPGQIADMVISTASEIDKPFVVLSTISGAVNRAVEERLRRGGVPLLRGAARGMAALGAYLATCHETSLGSRQDELFPGVPDELSPPVARLVERGGTLNEAESLLVLQACGIPVAKHALVRTPEEARHAARSLGGPVAVKACSAALPHKSDVGAVRVNVLGDAAVAEAAEQVIANAVHHVGAGRVDGILVQEMLTGTELIVGASRDRTFGAMVLLGLGGVLAEVLDDVALRRPPFGRAAAREMLHELRGASVLSGGRRAPAADEDAIVDVLVKLARIAIHLGPALAGLDINPLIVSGQGAWAADALIVLDPSSACRQAVADHR